MQVSVFIDHQYFPAFRDSLFHQVTFDAFHLRHQMSWRSVMDWFNREVQSIENEAKHFIDESFKSLRSAEGAFDMLLNFKHIR